MAGTDLASLLLQHSLTVVLVLLALRLARATSAARRVFVARCGLVALLLMPMLWLALPQAPVRLPLALSAMLDPPLAVPGDAVPAGLPSTATAFDAPARAAALGRLVLLVYALGVLFHLLRLALGVWGLFRVADAARPLEAPAWTGALAGLRRRDGPRRPVRLLVSDAIASPYSWGARRPVIVLDPRSAGGADAEAILAHELAHIRAHDWPALLLARCLVALYWWHPLMYPLLRALEHDTECAADDAVLAAGIAPSHYAHTLVSVSRRAFPAPAAATLVNRIAGQGKALLARVGALLEAGRPRGRVSGRQWLFGACATLALVCALGSLQLRGEHVIWPDRLLAGAGEGGGPQGAARMLEGLGNANFTQLAAAMRAGRFELRHAAVAESFRQRAAIPPLMLALRDRSAVVRRLAVWGLGEMRFPETAPAVAALLADPDGAVRAEAAGALGDMGEARWVAPMTAMLRDPDPRVRARVAHAFGDLGATPAMPMLAAALADPDAGVAAEARWALREMGSD